MSADEPVAAPVEATPAPVAEPAGEPVAQDAQNALEKKGGPAGFPGMLSAEKINISGGTTTLLYSAPISDKIVLAHCMATQAFPCSFALCHSPELKKASYVHLYEDRLEYNFASSVCYQIVDAPQIVYLDRDVAQLVAQPECCTPALTHCAIAPSCWDATGEMIMLHGEGTCCFVAGGKIGSNPFCVQPMTPIPSGCACPQLLVGQPLPCCNRNWIFIPFLENAAELKAQIRKARTALENAGLATPARKIEVQEQSRE